MEREWLGARYSVGEGEAFVWLELPTGILLDVTSIDPAAPVSFGQTLTDAMAEPGYGPPRRPTAIRVPEQSLADALRKAAGGIPVTIAPVPELEDVFADFCATMESLHDDEETTRRMNTRLILDIARFASADVDDDTRLMVWVTAAEEYREANGSQLSDAEHEWFDAQRASWLGIWAVERIEPGVLFLHDTLTGEERSVSEDRDFTPGNHLLARVVDYRNRSFLGGMHHRVFPPQAAALVIGAVRRKLGEVTIDRLRDPAQVRWMIDAWTEIVRAVQRRQK